MVLFVCLMSHPSIRRKLGNMVTHSKTCITGKWMDTWMNLQPFLRERERGREGEREMDYNLLLVMHSSISLLWSSEIANTAIVTLKSLDLRPELGKAPVFYWDCLFVFSCLFLNSWSPYFFGIGIICMTIHSGTLAAWSLLKLLFGTCPSSPPFCASASSRFSW